MAEGSTSVCLKNRVQRRHSPIQPLQLNKDGQNTLEEAPITTEQASITTDHKTKAKQRFCDLTQCLVKTQLLSQNLNGQHRYKSKFI